MNHPNKMTWIRKWDTCQCYGKNLFCAETNGWWYPSWIVSKVSPILATYTADFIGINLPTVRYMIPKNMFGFSKEFSGHHPSPKFWAGERKKTCTWLYIYCIFIFTHLSIYLFIDLSIYLFIYLSFFLSFFSFFLSFLSIHLCIYFCIYWFIYLSFIYLFFYFI